MRTSTLGRDAKQVARRGSVQAQNYSYSTGRDTIQDERLFIGNMDDFNPPSRRNSDDRGDDTDN